MFYGNKEFLKALCVESLIDHKIGCKCDIFFLVLIRILFEFLMLLSMMVVDVENICAEIEAFFLYKILL